jgi:hypothetical protein
MNIGQIILEVGGMSVFVFAATAYLKKLGIMGNALTLSSFGVGLLSGVVVRYASAPFATFADWAGAVLFGLMTGFLASGVYDGGKGIAGTDTAGVAATLKADNRQTAKIIAAVEPADPCEPEK